MLIKKSIFLLSASFIYASSLVDMSNIAIDNNFKLKSYKAQNKANYYKLQQAKDNYYPNVSLSGSISKDKYYYKYPTQNVKYNSTIKSYSLKISQVVYAPKIASLIKDNKLKLEYIKLQLKDYKQKFLNQFIHTYLNVLMYKNILDIYTQKLLNYQNMQNEIKQKLLVNFATKNDYLNINTQIIETKKNISQAKLLYQSNLQKLKIYTHLNKVIIKGKIVNTDSFDTNLKSDILDNPSYKLYKLNVDIAKNEIIKRKANFYPSVNINASYSDTTSDDSVTKRGEYMIGLNVNIPLYNKQNNDYYNEAKALYDSAYYDFLDYKNNLELNINEVIYQINILKNSIKNDLDNLKLRESLVNNASISYNSKLINLSSYLSKINDYYDSKIALIKDNNAILSKYIDYLYYKGNLNLEKIKIIQNQYLKD